MKQAVLVESQDFSPKLGPRPRWDENVYRYCNFDSLDPEGIHFAGVMTGCTLSRCHFYWGLFNTALLHEVRFDRCVFPGTSFCGSALVECKFENCEFILDNLGGDCTIEDCLIAECAFIGCRFVHQGPQPNTIFAKNRVMGSTHRGCIGIEALFAEQ